MAEILSLSLERSLASSRDGRDLLSWASSLVSTLFLVVLPWRLWHLRRSSVKVKPNHRAAWKLSLSFVLVLSSLVHLVLRWKLGRPSYVISDVDLHLGLAAAVGLGLLSFREHSRTVRPSSTIVLYLAASSALGLVRLALPSHSDRINVFYLLSSFTAVVNIALLVSECWGKEALLRGEHRGLPPEDTVSILSLTYFWWLHGLLVQGYSKLLTNDDLPRIDTQLDALPLRKKILAAWDRRQRPEKSTTLPRALLSCFSAPFTLAVIPRLFYVVFRFSQPILISRAISFVQQRHLEQESDELAISGFWVVVAAIAVYFGLATSAAIYQHKLNRLRVLVKGALVGLVHHKALTSRSHAYDDGRALTLMSTDVSSVETVAEMVHEIWGMGLEAVIAFSMLAAEIGWLWPVPLLIVLFFSQTSRHSVKPMKSRQAAWNAATQSRISLTSAVLAAIKSIKMLGIQAATEHLILQLRDHELNMAKAARWVTVAYNSSANALGMFAPCLTVAAYALFAAANGREFDTRTAFTTTAILSMVTHPVNMVMTHLPRIAASLASFERIQAYLLGPDNSDQRTVIHPMATSENNGQEAAILFQGVSIADPQTTRPILRDLNLCIERGALVICTGAVGSGKSSLIYATLGEASLQSGKISVTSKEIAYCSQTAWLPNRTIRDCILGLDEQVPVDLPRYEAALKACCLHEDLNELPHGDNTIVGTSGQNLSGGQRQRVALARAVYARNQIVLLDDSFSSLDSKTQTSVIFNLLGSDGLLLKNKTSVLWATNSTSHFHLADKIVLLADGTIQYQGAWESLRSSDHRFVRQIFAAAAAHNVAQSSDEVVESQSSQVQNGLLKRSAPIPSSVSVNPNRKDGDISLYTYYIGASGIGNFLLQSTCAAMYSVFFTLPPVWLKRWTESKEDHTLFYTSGYVLLLTFAWLSTSIMKWADLVKIAAKSGATLHRRLLDSILNAPLIFFSKIDLGTILNRFSQDIQLVDKQISTALSSLVVQIFKLIAQIVVLLASQPYLALTLPVCTAIVYVVQKYYLRTSRQLRRIELESQSAVYFNFLETAQGLTTIRAFGWQEAMSHQNAVSLDSSQRPLYLLLCLQRWLSVMLNCVVASLAVGTVWLAVAATLASTSRLLPAGMTVPTGGQIGVALNVILVTNATLISLVQAWTNLEVSLGAVARLREAAQETPQEEEKDISNPNQESRVRRADERVPTNWPSTGSVEFCNVTASYNPDTPVLHDVKLSIQPGQVAVICGRTGSGKSSLLMSLLRLLHVHATGQIRVDDVDLADLPLADIRERAFVTVMQDPFLLPSASLRFHLDPTETLPNTALILALEKMGLYGIFLDNSYDGAAGTITVWDRPLSSFPVLSAGQAQLLSLARALLQVQVRSAISTPSQGSSKRMPVILLDEITASLDAATEAAVYDVVEEVFIKGQQHGDTNAEAAGHTILIVTHRPAALTSRLRPGRDITVWMDNGMVERVEEISS